MSAGGGRMLPLIPEPLWGLMLSTKDCHPGCSCEADRFEIDPLRVSRWVARAGSTWLARVICSVSSARRSKASS